MKQIGAWFVPQHSAFFCVVEQRPILNPAGKQKGLLGSHLELPSIRRVLADPPMASQCFTSWQGIQVLGFNFVVT